MRPMTVWLAPFFTACRQVQFINVTLKVYSMLPEEAASIYFITSQKPQSKRFWCYVLEQNPPTVNQQAVIYPSPHLWLVIDKTMSQLFSVIHQPWGWISWHLSHDYWFPRENRGSWWWKRSSSRSSDTWSDLNMLSHQGAALFGYVCCWKSLFSKTWKLF